MDKLSIVKNKILTWDSIERQVALWKFQDKKTVFTNGCFDILHLGHIEYLARAASLGDVLIVGLNTDHSVKKLKGPSRPINDENSRMMLCASLFFVSAVILFDEPTPLELIRAIKPDVLVKGGDYKKEDIAGYDIVEQNGGEVTLIELTPGYSTSTIEQRIINNAK